MKVKTIYKIRGESIEKDTNRLLGELEGKKIISIDVKEAGSDKLMGEGIVNFFTVLIIYED